MICRHACLILGCIHVLAHAYPGISHASDRRDVVRAAADRYCGPRSVHFILQWYGHNEDLIEIIRETQWPAVEAGSSLAKLQDAIDSRGIHTCALRVGDGRRLTWSYPAIVFIPAATPPIGHYVVWLPTSSRSEVDFFCGALRSNARCE